MESGQDLIRDSFAKVILILLRWQAAARNSGYLLFLKANGQYELNRLKPPAWDKGWQALPTRSRDRNNLFEREVALIRLGR